MSDSFKFDVFLSHSSRDKAVVSDVTRRLKADGLKVWFDEWEIKPGDSIPARVEEGLEHSRVLVLCMSANAFGSDWAQLEAGTFRFRDPLNKERRLVPLRLDKAPIKGSLGQFMYINWLPGEQEQEYGKLLEACSPDKQADLIIEKQQQLLAKIMSLGHTAGINSVAWSPDGRRALSGAINGVMRLWDLEPVNREATDISTIPMQDQVQYTNAKVLLVGDTSSGKTGLAHRLATGKWQPSDGSTVGAWSTQWPLPDIPGTSGLEQEIWLWDFGGQADQRLVHQLYMDNAALILLLFDADKEDVLPGLREWQTALRRCVPPGTPHFLVAGRIDTGFKASRAKLQKFAAENGYQYHETSSREGTGCEKISHTIKTGIPWDRLTKRTSPRIFKLIKDQILTLRDAGQVLYTFKELREELWHRLPEEPRFNDTTLQTVITLLDGPCVVKELEYGTYILLQPEWINAYAQAVIRTLRQNSSELGCLPLRSIEEGKLLVLEVASRITSADQKCFEIPATEDEGIDMELEFTDDRGKGTGKRLYLQLKSGNSHLDRRKDGTEIFKIREQRWIAYWLKQPCPVMLVIGTFSMDKDRPARSDKLEFDQVRWMEITSCLQLASQNGTKPVSQIEFTGKRLDMKSIHEWRKKSSGREMPAGAGAPLPGSPE